MSNEKALLSPEEYDLYDEMAELELRNAVPVAVTAERAVWYAVMRAVIRGTEAIGKKVSDSPELMSFVKDVWERVFGYDAGCKKMLGHALATASARLEAPLLEDADPGNVLLPTYKGLLCFPYRPKSTVIDVEDIAHALSNLCAHQGHTGWFYSVAQHSVVLSKLCSPKFALEALLHEAVRAYLPEVPSLDKKHAWARVYREAEEEYRQEIAKQFDLLHPPPLELEVLHDHLCRWELCEIFEKLPHAVRAVCTVQPMVGLDKITPLLPEEAEEEFLERLWELKNERTHGSMGTALDEPDTSSASEAS